MPLNREQKAELVKQLGEKIQAAKAVVFADYQGLTVGEMDELRSKMREKGVEFQIAKKTLIKRAAKDAGFDEISPEVLEGPVGTAFSMEEEIAAAKVLHAFAKTNDKLKLRGALFEGRVLSVAETKQLALLPGREELTAKLVYLLKSPIQGFHGVLSNTISGFVRVLNAVKEKQEQSA